MYGVCDTPYVVLQQRIQAEEDRGENRGISLESNELEGNYYNCDQVFKSRLAFQEFLVFSATTSKKIPSPSFLNG